MPTMGESPKVVLRVKLPVWMLSAAMSSLNVAVTGELIAITAPCAGTWLITSGAMVSLKAAVVNVQTLLTVMGLPAKSATTVLTVAVKDVLAGKGAVMSG